MLLGLVLVARAQQQDYVDGQADYGDGIATQGSSQDYSDQQALQAPTQQQDYSQQQGYDAEPAQTVAAYQAPAYAPYASAALHVEQHKCYCHPSKPCYNPASGACVETECPASASAPPVSDGTSYYRHLRQLIQNPGETSQRHFACSTCYCPDNTSRCTSCWNVSKTGVVIFWVGFGIFTAATMVFLFMGFTITGSDMAIFRITPFMSASITLVAAINYLIFATGHGFMQSCPDHRPMYYSRYIEWLITTPLMLILLSKVGAIEPDNTCFIIFLDVTMVLSGFVGSFVTNGAKWAFFAFGVLALLPIFYVLGNSWRSWQAIGLGRHPSAGSYSAALVITMVTWSGYAVMWILTDGTHAICRDTEMVWFLVLDIFSKVVFCFALNAWRAKYGSTTTIGAAVAHPVAGGSII